MSAYSIPVLVSSLIGVGAMVWGGAIALSAYREYRRSRTVTVEILSVIQLETERAYRFQVIDEKSSPGGGDAKWMGAKANKFGDRTFEVGEHVQVDYDPGYPVFLYPPRAYPKCRMWLPALSGVLAGGAVVVSVNGFF
ncbi:hypothetical protein [Streptomyces sp. NPDC045714]|uniref:hypothetical protein n=1 Tax=Streptomyces sp. NPDC045714 TaxID=3154913 RepID=UPI00340D5BBB